MKNKKYKGYLLAFIATISLANVYIFSKAAMKEIVFAQFAFYWFGLAIIWNLLFILKQKKLYLFKTLTKRLFLIISLIGVFEVFGTYSFFTAIKIVANPANVSFMGNLTPLFIVIFGITFLRERYNIVEIGGIILIISGAFLISYQGNTSLNEIFMKGTWIIVLACSSFAVATILSKKFIHEIDPVLLSMNRVIYLFALSVLLLLVTKKSILIPRYAFYNITIGSILGPFVTSFASYSSLLYIEASRSSIIQSTKGFFVIIGAIIYFEITPKTNEITGGILTILGIILISLGGKIVLYFKNKKTIAKLPH